MELPSSQRAARPATGRFEEGWAGSVAERFWRRVAIDPDPSACWKWTGARKKEWGYGLLTVSRKATRAHRVSWELANGPIPAGMCVCHRCDNPPCVNPAHLFLGTDLDNKRDMWTKGRMKEPPNGTDNRAKTHCPQGHEYTPENTRIKPRGKRSYRLCFMCLQEYRRKKWQRYKRGEHPTGS